MEFDKARSLLMVKLRRLSSLMRGTNCLGKLLRLKGQSRVPDPPHKITGVTFLLLCLSTMFVLLLKFTARETILLYTIEKV